MNKIIIVSGTRADYGIFIPVAKLLSINNWDVSFAVSGMHLSHKFGYTKQIIENDGFRICGEVQSIFLENSKGNMARSVSLEISGFTNIFEKEKPDFILLLGDRGEMLAAAISAMYLGIKTGHIHGGEVSGTVDESIRHAISKLSSIHFTSTEKSSDRLLKMGEDNWRIFRVGAPRLDSIIHSNLPDFESINKKYGWNLVEKEYILQLFHPVVTELAEIRYQVMELISSIKKTELPVLCILPNADAGGDIIRSEYKKWKGHAVFFSSNLDPDEYLRILKECLFMIGNSSSGIIEAASYNVPVVNLGSRQAGREQSENTINSEFIQKDIDTAIQTVLSEKFQCKIRNSPNVYGDGTASDHIVKVLNNISKDKDLKRWIQKQIAY
ncbi:UDP-N-acetylglucosamine 2-epimerase [Candidatus Enterococcus ferrettii]|uniref:UDP-N-acetyl-D-glucosamine 2-epimerase, UDP-hydrolyzing n=1 Tax=Candidatus Enterococcus ferrettii TaxID=2815324 RepID=A0ABV0EYN8_9ENTE|nr:UDP-N-acetylglucosamine 2-epimerase [Enterococcus sp. 665A]MBO1342778.1 UDP-N-acetylglucosamine 2-epimerase (hydrolyzing) [Enterococcus sp. 665A]